MHGACRVAQGGGRRGRGRTLGVVSAGARCAPVRARAHAGGGPAVALDRLMLTIILVILLIAFLAGGGFGYSRWGLGGMSPALLIGIVLLVLLFTRRL